MGWWPQNHEALNGQCHLLFRPMPRLFCGFLGRSVFHLQGLKRWLAPCFNPVITRVEHCQRTDTRSRRIAKQHHPNFETCPQIWVIMGQSMGCASWDLRYLIPIVPGRAGAEVSKRAMTKISKRQQGPVGMPVKCTSNERLRVWGASMKELMVSEMPMKWHESRCNQWHERTIARIREGRKEGTKERMNEQTNKRTNERMNVNECGGNELKSELMNRWTIGGVNESMSEWMDVWMI